jgi:hypothetical protein
MVVGLLAAGGVPSYERSGAETSGARGANQAIASAVEAAPARQIAAPIVVPPGLPPALYDIPAAQALPPRANAAINVHIGPNENYVIVGVLPRGATLDIIGRDASSQWIAIAFPPNSTMTAWIPASGASGLASPGSLKEVPVRSLP